MAKNVFQIHGADAEGAPIFKVLKTRALLLRQQTQAINSLRGHLPKLGNIAATRTAKVAELIAIVRDEEKVCCPKPARLALAEDQIQALTRQVNRLERGIVGEVKRGEEMRRLITIPGVGARRLSSKRLSRTPKDSNPAVTFAAWLGLMPKPHSSGGKHRLGGMSKMGNPTLRSPLVCGATSVLRRVKVNEKAPRWLIALLARRPFKVAAVALANKISAIIWALPKGASYRNTNVASGAARA
ncbi:transposase [Bradyrhizobium sp. CW11]|uniref:transposase n=1 Tax=Bradyrhizobium sp. CW11 TaxID=2782684 RepID=UPI001FFB8C11|nr:transposase [Bradyrhizobium sp. CW11]MCK1343125.1 transposase [Bradyrhizobium sp. CW11]MCK1704518.1 transposase [Bradyrhizobium sp. 146]